MSSLLEPTKIACRNSERLVSQLLGILQSQFNLSEFYYYNIDSAGQFFCFQASNLELVESLEKNGLLHIYPFYCDIRHPRKMNQTTFYTDDPMLTNAPKIKNCFSHFDYRLGVQLRRRNNTNLEEFGFHSAATTPNDCKSIWNYIPELRLFAQWFLNENQSIMEFLKENPIDLAKIIGPEFYRNRILEADPIYQERKKFLTALGIRQELELSTTDIDTIRLLLKGYSASQIAKLLYRSKRTIEHRIENIKLKWNCCSKAELIQKAQKLSNEGALSYNTF